MKTIVSLILAGLLAVPVLSAQTAPAGGTEPQLAYRILMGYIQEQERDAALAKPVAGWTTFGLGATAVLGGATLWFEGDSLASSTFDTTLDPKVKFWTTAGLVGGGALLAGVGSLILTSPSPDFRIRFNDVLTAPDPQVQNRLAAATLQTLADEGRSKRLVSGWVGILTPVVSMGLTAAINTQNGKPWSENIISINSAQLLGVVGGVSQLFEISPEELLFQKYQTASGTRP